MTVTGNPEDAQTVKMPYISSLLSRREDRPKVIPTRTENFAFVGQFTELPDHVVLTVEYLVQLMHADYHLFGVDKPLPPIYRVLPDPLVGTKLLR